VFKARKFGWTFHVTRVGERRGVYRFLARKPDGNESFGMPRRRREYNNNAIIKEVGWGKEWIDLAQNMDSFPSV